MAVPSPVTISSDDSDDDVDNNTTWLERLENQQLEGLRACIPKIGWDGKISYGETSGEGETEVAHGTSSGAGNTDSHYIVLDDVVEVCSSVGSDFGDTRLDPAELEARKEQAKKEEARKERATKEEARIEAIKRKGVAIFSWKEEVRRKEAREKEARQEEARNEEARKEVARKEEARKEEARKEVARKEEARKEEARKEVARKEEARKEEARKEVARKEEARKEEARKEVARKEEARTEEARKQKAKEEEARKQEAEKEEAEEKEARKEEAKKGVKRKSEDDPADKGKKKANTALEKEAKKQQLAEEKAAQKAAREMNKIYKSGECMKYMHIEGHPTLWARWYMADVAREAAAAGARVAHAPALCDPALVVWARSLPRTLDSDTGQVRLTPSQERCDRALYIASADELCELVSSRTLATQLAQIQQLCGCDLTLVVFRVDDYFKSPTRRKTSNSNRTPMTEVDLELAITDLLVSAKCDTVIVNTPNELALLIVQFTKAIAKAPLKKAQRECDEKANFFMRGDNKKCVRVDRDGTGTSRLWQQMIAILPQSSLETSRAICSRYKTPLALYQALQSSNSISEIANIGVSRAGVPGSKARRVGPEFARKLHTLFTAQDGDTLVE